MVRVGGGWIALDEFLLKNDPCRGMFCDNSPETHTNSLIEHFLNFEDQTKPSHEILPVFSISTAIAKMDTLNIYQIRKTIFIIVLPGMSSRFSLSP
jgi:hypothetical protein